MQQSVNEEMILEPQEEIRDVQESCRLIDVEKKKYTPCHYIQFVSNLYILRSYSFLTSVCYYVE